MDDWMQDSLEAQAILNDWYAERIAYAEALRDLGAQVTTRDILAAMVGLEQK